MLGLHWDLQESFPDDPARAEEELDALIERYTDNLAQYRETMQAAHTIEVRPENWQAVQVFLDCAGEWTTPGSMGGRYHLPSAEIERMMDSRQITEPGIRRDTFRRAQIIKREAGRVMNEQYRNDQER